MISSSQSSLLLRDEDDGEVRLRTIPSGRPFEEANELVLIGGKFATEAEASKQAQQWRGILEKAFAWVNIGADFGDRAPHGLVTKHGRQLFGDSPESPVLNDVHGIMVFECEPQPRFASVGTPTVVIGVQEKRLKDAIDAAMAVGAVMSDRAQVAYDLYSSSFMKQASPDARFAMLMMAVETLIELEPRSDATRDHVDALIRQTKESGLTEPEIQSLIGSLSGLRDESISQAGRRLARHLHDRQFMGETADQFFTKCYTLRGKLLHGEYPRPTRDEVGAYVSELEHFVRLLLSLELVDTLND